MTYTYKSDIEAKLLKDCQIEPIPHRKKIISGAERPSKYPYFKLFGSQ